MKKQISKRMEAYNNEGKASLAGIWTGFEDGNIILTANIGPNAARTILTLTQAKALRTLLDLEINKAEKTK